MCEYFENHIGNYNDENPTEYFKFKYPLDHFQLHGCKAIDNNENILVTAHTGSGKTCLALYGIAKTLLLNKKVIYTSPIKTLSNQKYAEFLEHFKSIGIMTGDIKINPIADLLIMTAEILRNSLLQSVIIDSSQKNSELETSCTTFKENSRTTGDCCTTFKENSRTTGDCCTINSIAIDSRTCETSCTTFKENSRTCETSCTTFKENSRTCETSCTTVKQVLEPIQSIGCTFNWKFNPDDIGCVILDEVHFINNPERGKVWEEIIINLKPNIQLIMLSATITGAEEMAKWIGNLKKVKCHLISTLKRPVPLKHGIWWENEINYFLHGDKNWIENIWNILSNKINNFYKNNKFSLNQFFNCIKYLFDNDLTPANVFLLNRKLLEQYAKKIPYYFVTSEETGKIQQIWKKKLHKYNKFYDKTTEWNDLYLLVSKGIGIHHSGMIPILKEIVEILYEQGLIKILLATETFAMGVNMPTKTVVFCETTKYDGINEKRILRPEEYGQMAGRSGRRGKDVVGHVIILPTPYFIDEEQAKIMIQSKPQTIISKLSIDPIFIIKQILNIKINNIDELIKIIIEFCNNSLFNYQENNNNYLLKNKYEELNNEIKIIEEKLYLSNEFNQELYLQYYKLIEINNKLKPNGFIKISNNIYKKLILEKKDLLKKINIQDLNIIEDYINKKTNINNLEIKLLKNKTKLNNQINIIINFLIKLKYIDNNFELTKIGILMSEINECNPFLISYIIYNNYLDNLEFNEIVALFSIFINENKSPIDIYISELNCTNICKDILYKIDDSINNYKQLEDELNKELPYPSWLDWNINYSMFNITLDWASNNIQNIDITGNFIKTILRITNLLKNIESIAINLNNIKLFNKLEGFEEKLIRDYVTTDSLYL